MDLQGSLVDTNLRIYPDNNLMNYLKSLPIDDDVPDNIVKFVKGKNYEIKKNVHKDDAKTIPVYLDSKDIENLNKIKSMVKEEEVEIDDIENISKEVITENDVKCDESGKDTKEITSNSLQGDSSDKSKTKDICNEKTNMEKEIELHLTTSDIDWLYAHLQKLKNKGQKSVPYLHTLLEGAQIGIPENSVIKRNPILEARCVKLRAQQEARQYRKMTKSVDNVRMRFPEDSISYQLKQVNRQLIAIGQFIISIFAGFLFGFKGLEWMIGNLDFGFRLLMGVMCALIIALAEIYFLAKKLNEELNVPETVQLGGPPKFADSQKYGPNVSNKAIDKEHQD